MLHKYAPANQGSGLTQAGARPPVRPSLPRTHNTNTHVSIIILIGQFMADGARLPL